jgi:DNA-binding CsgD family transcriptional regulator
MFSGIGAEAFAERARHELRATGEHVRRRTFEALVKLTAQETQIARLARDGSTNTEIGSRLFISPRTVEWICATCSQRSTSSHARSFATHFRAQRMPRGSATAPAR